MQLNLNTKEVIFISLRKTKLNMIKIVYKKVQIKRITLLTNFKFFFDSSEQLKFIDTV